MKITHQIVHVVVVLLLYDPSFIKLDPSQLLLVPTVILCVVVILNFGGMLGDIGVYLPHLILKTHVAGVQSCKLTHINVVLRKGMGRAELEAPEDGTPFDPL